MFLSLFSVSTFQIDLPEVAALMVVTKRGRFLKCNDGEHVTGH